MKENAFTRKPDLSDFLQKAKKSALEQAKGQKNSANPTQAQKLWVTRLTPNKK